MTYCFKRSSNTSWESFCVTAELPDKTGKAVRRRSRFSLWRRYLTRVWPVLGKRCHGSVVTDERGEILLLKRDNIGDFVIATTFLNVAYRRWRARPVTLVCSPSVAELARLLYPDWTIRPVSQVPPVEYRKPRWRPGVVQREVKAWSRAEIAISLRAMRFQEEMIFDSWVPAKSKVAVENTFRYHEGRYLMVPDERVFSDVLPAGLAQSPELCADIAHQRQLLKRFFPDEPAEAGWPELQFGASFDGVTASLRRKAVRTEGALVLCPFPSAAIKRYPEERLLAVASIAARKYGLRIEIMGGPDDRNEALAMAEKLSAPLGVSVSAGKLSLVESALAISAARLVLGVDTGLMHMAIASKVPTVVILGGAHYGIFGPWGDPARTRWVTEPMACFHCNWECVHPEAFCITRIAQARIEEAIDAVWCGSGR
jgi:ADP-heptose:LPS heptosyltransferase